MQSPLTCSLSTPACSTGTCSSASKTPACSTKRHSTNLQPSHASDRHAVTCIVTCSPSTPTCSSGRPYPHTQGYMQQCVKDPCVQHLTQVHAAVRKTDMQSPLTCSQSTPACSTGTCSSASKTPACSTTQHSTNQPHSKTHAPTQLQYMQLCVQDPCAQHRASTCSSATERHAVTSDLQSADPCVQYRILTHHTHDTH